MAHKRTHIVIPVEVTEEIDRLVGQRRRSQFLVDAAKREIQRLRTIESIQEAAGSWKERDHPELSPNSAAWIHKIRREGESRRRKLTRR